MGEILVVTEVLNKHNPGNNKNDPVVDTEDWRLTMSVYMTNYDNYMRDERQWGANNRKKYIRPGAQAL